MTNTSQNKKQSEDTAPQYSQNTSVSDLSGSEIEITGEVSSEQMQAHRSEAMDKLREEVEVDGFRKGQAPDSVIENKVGEQRILQETAEAVLKKEYPRLLMHHQINPIGAPQISITKLAPDNPMEFKIRTAVMPEIKLPDYKTLAGQAAGESEDPQKAGEDISSEEVDEVITNLENQLSQQNQDSGEDSGLVSESGEPLTSSQFKLTDDNVGQLGNFSSLAELREQIASNIRNEKVGRATDQRRLNIMEKIIANTDFEVPELLVNEELRQITKKLQQDVENAGYSFDDYLKQIQKTQQDLESEWRPQAEKRARIQLILNQIADEEQLEPDQEVLEQQTQNILQQYQDAEPEQVRAYVRTQLLNEQAFRLLEQQDDSSSAQGTKTASDQESAEKPDNSEPSSQDEPEPQTNTEQDTGSTEPNTEATEDQTEKEQ